MPATQTSHKINNFVIDPDIQTSEPDLDYEQTRTLSVLRPETSEMRISTEPPVSLGVQPIKRPSTQMQHKRTGMIPGQLWNSQIQINF